MSIDDNDRMHDEIACEEDSGLHPVFAGILNSAKHKCTVCKGRGYLFVPNGGDDNQAVECSVCGGKG